MNMLSLIFKVHGNLCTNHPWEVIIGTFTLTVCAMSMSIFGYSEKICGWSYDCPNEHIQRSDVIILTITKCLAVIYIYLQFRKLRKLGSKYLLGISGVFTIFSSFVFSIAVINFFGIDMTGLNEALPFFLLVIDLTKATTLAKYALRSQSQNEVKENISCGIAVMGPVITLDALVQILVIGVGTISGVKQLETMCCFGCLSIITNYLAFMTFYPAALTLVLELGNNEKFESNMPMSQLSTKVLDYENEKNPVSERIKMIMSIGLVIVHGHSYFVGNDLFGKNVLKNKFVNGMSHSKEPTSSLWYCYYKQSTSPTFDSLISVLLAMILAVKYIWFDSIKISCYQDDSNNSSDDEPDAQITFTASKEQDVDISFIIGDSEKEIMKQFVDKQVQTSQTFDEVDLKYDENEILRSSEDCLNLLKVNSKVITDAEIINLVETKQISCYKLESILGDEERAVKIRRNILKDDLFNRKSIENLPYLNFDYSLVTGACCENVIGYIPIPVGICGPLLLDGQQFHVPMATTEGCLVASTNRGCRALIQSGGVRSCIVMDGMTRAPVVRLGSATRAAEVKLWLENNFNLVAEEFESTSSFAKLQRLHVIQAARYLYIRFVSKTGDAMGMNMISKGVEKSLFMIQDKFFTDLEILSLSGNVCTDKKAAAINWIEGRGKSVICDAIIPETIIKNILKANVNSLCDLNISKNLMGSAMAGVSVGGFNAHASNIVTAIFLATGQDVAQNVESSNCLTLFEPHESGGLYISCTMPSIEVGTIGGGTVLSAQKSCLDMLGIAGSSKNNVGENARLLSRIVCATVLAGELSLMSALSAGHLVKSHMKHNRSNIALATQSNPTLCCNKLQ